MLKIFMGKLHLGRPGHAAAVFTIFYSIFLKKQIEDILENIHGQGTPGTPRRCAAALFILENTEVQIQTNGTHIEHHLKSLSQTF